MMFRFSTWRLSAFAVSFILGGCVHPDCLPESKNPRPGEISGSRPVPAAEQQAADAESPPETPVNDDDVHSERESQPLTFEPPRPIRHPKRENMQEMSLHEAVVVALENNPVIRVAESYLSPNNQVLTNPSSASSSFDLGIQASDVFYENRGVLSANADFDPQLQTSMIWSRSEDVQNNLFSVGIPPGTVLHEEAGRFRSRLEKTLRDGSTLSFSHDWFYSGNNAPRLFPSAYEGFIGAEYRRPLLAGGGKEFISIAGPAFTRLRGVTGVAQGTWIAQINQEISQHEFEESVHLLVKDVADLYWNLKEAYLVYDIEQSAWYDASELRDQLKNEANISEIQSLEAEEAVLAHQSRMQESLLRLYEAEGQLRRLIGLPVSSQLVLVPSESAQEARISADWHQALAKAFEHRAELREQHARIRSLELQVVAARKLVRPQVDFVSRYRVNAFGDQLLAGTDRDEARTAAGLNSAYETIVQGDFTGWTLGLEGSIPLGFRQAKTQVHNLESQLAKARASLQEQELEISHELAHAFRQIEGIHLELITNRRRVETARQRLNAVTEAYQKDEVSMTDVRRARLDGILAALDYFEALIQYNRAIGELFHRQGRLLEMLDVHLLGCECDNSGFAAGDVVEWSSLPTLPIDEKDLVPLPPEKLQLLLPETRSLLNDADSP